MECEAKICSINVEPTLGSPRTNIGSFVSRPQPALESNKSRVHTSF